MRLATASFQFAAPPHIPPIVHVTILNSPPPSRPLRTPKPHHLSCRQEESGYGGVCACTAAATLNHRRQRRIGQRRWVFGNNCWGEGGSRLVLAGHTPQLGMRNCQEPGHTPLVTVLVSKNDQRRAAYHASAPNGAGKLCCSSACI